VNYSWIQLPQALSNGCRYTVTLGNGFSGNMLYDESKTISGAIHANQIGYLDWAAEKYAYIGAWGGTHGPIEFPDVTNQQFHIMDASGTSVYSGAITLRYDPTLYDPAVYVDGQSATDATSYWSRVITLPQEDVATTVTVTMVTALGVTNESVDRVYTWSSGSTDTATVENHLQPQNNYTSATAQIEIRAFPNTEPVGEYVYEMDFGAFSETGTFYIAVEGVGRSWPFEVGPDVYGEPFYKAMKGLYQHRSGFEITSNRLAWARPAAHTNVYRSHIGSVDSTWPLAEAVNGSGTIGFFEQASAEMWNLRYACGSESNFNVFVDNPRAQPEWEKVLNDHHRIPDCYGGWYDAADYDNRPGHLPIIYELVAAYLSASNAMVDGICNMDESGNGIPDILDECLWGLRVYRKSQRADGGVSIRFESHSHPHNGHGINDTQPYFASYPDRTSALRYSAAAALMSWAIRPFDVAIADDYLHSASNAYAFSQNPENRVRNLSYWYWYEPYDPPLSAIFRDHAPTMLQFRDDPSDPFVYVDYAHRKKWNSGSSRIFRLEEYRYDEPEDFFPPSAYNTAPFAWHAPFCLHLASGNAAYADIVNATKDTFDFLRDDNTWNMNFLVAITDSEDLDESLKTECRDYLIDTADDLVTVISNTAYRTTREAPGSWGTSTLQVDSRLLIQAYTLTGNTNYLTKALLINDFSLGCRPMGFVFTTGMGWNYITRLLNYVHEEAGLDDPTPGIPTYAPTGGTDHRWRWRGYALEYSRSFSALYSGSTNVCVHPLPPPFDKAGDHPGRHIPSWRKAQIYEGNAGMWEYTVSETIAPTIHGFAPFVREGWMPGDGLTNMVPKAKSELYGYYFMP